VLQPPRGRRRDALYDPDIDMVVSGVDPLGRESAEARQLDLRSENRDWVPAEVRPEMFTIEKLGISGVRAAGQLPKGTRYMAGAVGR